MSANTQSPWPVALDAAREQHSNEVHAQIDSYPNFRDQVAFEAAWWVEEERHQERQHFPNLACDTKSGRHNHVRQGMLMSAISS